MSTNRAVPAHATRAGSFARRAIATAIDYSLAAAPLATFGLAALLRRSAAGAAPPIGVQGGPGISRLKRVLGVLGVTAPVTFLLAAAEAHGGSPGKRLLGLEVRTANDRAPVPFRRALVRAILKTGVPWELGHQAVWDFHGGDDHQRRGTVLAGCAYLAIAAQAVMAVRDAGRTYADLAAGTVVIAGSATSRPPSPPRELRANCDER
ncbi:MAG: RDD family protein [Pseudonocardiaceae bacterium]